MITRLGAANNLNVNRNPYCKCFLGFLSRAYYRSPSPTSFNFYRHASKLCSKRAQASAS